VYVGREKYFINGSVWVEGKVFYKRECMGGRKSIFITGVYVGKEKYFYRGVYVGREKYIFKGSVRRE
jgi:hypothetical protein